VAAQAALKEMNELFDEPIRSMVCAPVIANDGTVLGAVLVVNRVGASKFSSDDQLALASFAKVLA
jgi:GAF domain-containing protein